MNGGRVLVVDDTAFNRRLLVRLLTSIGHEAIEAEHFLILPHGEVAEYVRRKASDHDRWLRGMRRLV